MCYLLEKIHAVANINVLHLHLMIEAEALRSHLAVPGRRCLYETWHTNSRFQMAV